jgi:site-specific recombinase XerD
MIATGQEWHSPGGASAAGVDEPGLHAFRRAFAVNCLCNGMDLVSLQRLLGHGDRSTVCATWPW